MGSAKYLKKNSDSLALLSILIFRVNLLVMALNPPIAGVIRSGFSDQCPRMSIFSGPDYDLRAIRADDVLFCFESQV